MINIVKRLAFLLFLIPVTCQPGIELTPTQMVEMATAAALVPATIIDAIVDCKGSEKTQKVTRTLVEGCYLLNSAIATFNHRDDVATNKYNMFRLLTHGFYFAKNIYDLNKTTSPSQSANWKPTQSHLGSKMKTGLAAMTKFGLGCFDGLYGCVLASKVAENLRMNGLSDDGYYFETEVNFNPVMSSLLSLSMSARKALDQDNFKKRMAWIGAASANVLFLFRDAYIVGEKMIKAMDDARDKRDEPRSQPPVSNQKIREAYQELGLTQGAADQVAVKRAYRQLSLQYHPDKNPSNRVNAEVKMKNINAARDIIAENLRCLGQWQD